jgi:hypothetical protein
LFVDLFLEAHQRPPKQIILDLDATDDPLHGIRRGGSFTATTTAIAICRCTSSVAGICWRPSCGAPISMRRPGAVEETARIVAQIRARWPESLPRA